jgi:hypothetical protein
MEETIRKQTEIYLVKRNKNKNNYINKFILKIILK